MTSQELDTEGIRSRVVSMPSRDMFECETQAYRDSVRQPEVKAHRNRTSFHVR
jgi:transketolase